MTDLDRKVKAIRTRQRLSQVEQAFSLFDVFDHFMVPYRGRFEHQISCPLHKDIKPSGRVYPETDSFYCFSCKSALTSARMAQRLLEASMSATLDYLIDAFEISIDESALDERQKEVEERGTVKVFEAYKVIANVADKLFNREEVFIRLNRLDKIFLSLSPSEDLLQEEFDSISESILV